MHVPLPAPWTNARHGFARVTTNRMRCPQRETPMRFTSREEPSICPDASNSTMPNPELALLQNPEVRARTSDATLRALQERADPPPRTERFFSDEQFDLLQQLVDTILPQAPAATHVNIADAIDRRLQKGKSIGWRYASLPPEGEAYKQGLQVLFSMLQHTPMKTFAAMPTPAREGYLRCVVNGDVDGPAQFPLSTWMKTVKTEVVRTWISHPDTMHAMEYFGFADGPTGNEGWIAIGPNSAAPFEYRGDDLRGGTAPDATRVSGSMGDGSPDAPTAAGDPSPTAGGPQ